MLAYHTLFNIFWYLCLSHTIFVTLVALPNMLCYHIGLTIARASCVSQPHHLCYHLYRSYTPDLMLDIFEWWCERYREEHKYIVVEPELAIQVSIEIGNDPLLVMDPHKTLTNSHNSQLSFELATPSMSWKKWQAWFVDLEGYLISGHR